MPGVFAVLWGLVLCFVWVPERSRSLLQVVLLCVIITVVIPAWSLNRARVVLDPDEIGHAKARLLGRVRRWPRSEVGMVVRANLMGPPSPFTTTSAVHNVFVLDTRGKLLIRAKATIYTRHDLDRLVTELGVRVRSAHREVTAEKFASIYPGLVWWFERRIVLVLVIVTTTPIAATLLFCALVAWDVIRL
ncbi:hypothetical protein [Nocardia grenadensis]|uniref:hypothetical protein n=1 Tax=Nocardia grenadensis TaxID=931537 RepID=UPI003D750112